MSLPAGLPRPIADSVIEDICFLKYLNNEFFLCETATKVREALASPDPCWEKRWAGMLGKWEQRVEMDWEDINETGGVTRKSGGSARTLYRVDVGRSRKHSFVTREQGSDEARQSSPRDSSVSERE